jgi:hypothetical protein
MRLANRVEQFAGGSFLQEITASAVADGFKDTIGVVKYRQHHYLHLPAALAKQSDALRSGHARQIDIEQQDVRLIGHKIESIFHRAALPDALKRGRAPDQRGKAFPGWFVVLYNRDANCFGRGG